MRPNVFARRDATRRGDNEQPVKFRNLSDGEVRVRTLVYPAK